MIMMLLLYNFEHEKIIKCKTNYILSTVALPPKHTPPPLFATASPWLYSTHPGSLLQPLTLLSLLVGQPIRYL